MRKTGRAARSVAGKAGVGKTQKKTAVKKPLDTPEPLVVTSQESTNVTGPTAQKQPIQAGEKNMELVRDNKPRKGHNGKAAHYNVAGLRGSVKISSTLFDGEAPATLNIDWPLASPSTPKAKMTPEQKAAAAAERKAANAAKTPAQKLADQEARLAKQALNLAARKAKLGVA